MNELKYNSILDKIKAYRIELIQRGESIDSIDEKLVRLDKIKKDTIEKLKAAPHEHEDIEGTAIELLEHLEGR